MLNLTYRSLYIVFCVCTWVVVDGIVDCLVLGICASRLPFFCQSCQKCDGVGSRAVPLVRFRNRRPLSSVQPGN